jgi:type IV pilus assembly protein PilC
MLLKVTPDGAIEITSDVVDNEEYRVVFQKTADQVKKGFTISSILKSNPVIIPPIVSQMIYVAEETGKLEEILKRISKFYSEETSRTLDTLVTLIEPLMVVVMAGFVFVLILAVLMPFYNFAAGGF